MLTTGATTRHREIAVTTPARTIDDLSGHVSPALVRRAIRQADFTGLPIGGHAAETERTRSDLETRFLRICRRYRLPEPEVNVGVGAFTVDFLWREARLIAETDGYGSHRGQQAFEDDHRRDNELAALGYDVVRFTYLRVMHEPAQVADLVRARLDRRVT